MIFELNSFTIDVIFVFFCIFFSLVGYYKGFISRFYDLLGTILCLIVSLNIYKYFSGLFSFIPVNELTENIIFIPILNNIISFVIVFIVLYIIKKIFGIIIKPILNSIINFLKITGFINRLLGLIFSFFESIIISYIVLLIMMTPLINNGYHYVNNTIIAKEVLTLIPEYSNNLIDWSKDSIYIIEDYLTIKDDYIVDFIMKSYELGMINDEQINNLINESDLDIEIRNKIKDKVSDLS